jgi:hypothetical protein
MSGPVVRWNWHLKILWKRWNHISLSLCKYYTRHVQCEAYLGEYNEPGTEKKNYHVWPADLSVPVLP